ncbi:helix-turn-helix domain-containing protein [Enterococcus casseliflavus]|uniref:helix-turn-helix domain-containing protein n=1 Tax=Enterococcus casseliflavus TaxID=37734 RepID=UPI001E60C722|nr:helix-turn-helix domain-containing protein [Enterococcus casseliflavus]MCD5161412.1 helix-turn-helix domain-containing protein [Enterococcus casseliflavus]MCD5192436.1 helix-turn-helix domain-containing protein [Enterococcus casseliflavus]
MKKNTNNSFLATDVIISAISGDPIAMSKVLNHYQRYIVSLSLRNNYINGVLSSVYIDEFMRRSIESKLIEKVMTFDIDR